MIINMRTNNNNLVDFSKEYTYVASESLVQEAKEKHSNIYLNFCYTDYGGSFLNKVIISYFKEYYPENIVFESTSWNGENAFLFGEPSEALYYFMEDGNLFGFDNLEEYYTEKQCLMIAEATQEYINDNELSNDLYDIVRDWFFENGYLEPNYIDYSEHDLNEYIKHYTL